MMKSASLMFPSQGYGVRRLESVHCTPNRKRDGNRPLARKMKIIAGTLTPVAFGVFHGPLP